MKSILQQARDEGWAMRADYEAQLDECAWDEGYEDGRRDAHAEAPSRFRWFALGALAAAMFGYFLSLS